MLRAECPNPTSLVRAEGELINITAHSYEFANVMELGRSALNNPNSKSQKESWSQVQTASK